MKAIIEVKNDKQLYEMLEQICEATKISLPPKFLMSYRTRLDRAFSLTANAGLPDEGGQEAALIRAVTMKVMKVFTGTLKAVKKHLPKNAKIYVSQLNVIISDVEQQDNFGGDRL